MTRRMIPAARVAIYGALDARDSVLGREKPWYVPPRRLGFVGGGDFEQVGRSFVRQFTDLGDLGPDSDVLDIGSGVGRMAIPLTGVLSPESRYEGFDVVPAGVEWCRQRITPRHPNFTFTLLDLYNRRYNPDGQVRAEELRFPYAEESFDLAIATSVFTHLPPAVVANYLAEAVRVLRPGGRLLGTWYALGGDRARTSGPEGNEEAWFPAQLDGYRSVSARVPEFATAFEESRIEGMHWEAGFAEVEVHHGRWLGGPGRAFQDLVVAGKPVSEA